MNIKTRAAKCIIIAGKVHINAHLAAVDYAQRSFWNWMHNPNTKFSSYYHHDTRYTRAYNLALKIFKKHLA